MNSFSRHLAVKVRPLKSWPSLFFVYVRPHSWIMIRGLPVADLSPNLANKSHISLQKKWLGPLFFEKCGNQWFRPRVSGVNVMQWRRTFEWIFYGRIHYWTWTDLSSEFECNGIDYLGEKWTAEREERGLCYKMQLFQLADQKSNEWAAGWHLSTVGNPSCISRNPIHFFFHFPVLNRNQYQQLRNQLGGCHSRKKMSPSSVCPFDVGVQRTRLAFVFYFWFRRWNFRRSKYVTGCGIVAVGGRTAGKYS